MALSPKAVKTITDTVSKAVKKASEKVAKREAEELGEEAAKKAAKAREQEESWASKKKVLEKKYGSLQDIPAEKTKLQKMRNTPEAVQKRVEKAKRILSEPVEPWTPPPAELQAFDRSIIKDALEGFPGIEQSRFPRDIPARTDISYVEDLFTDPVNRELIIQQIERGLPLGGETFYASLYPIKQAVLEAGGTADDFTRWVHELAPASARNSILNEMAVGQFLRDLNAKGVELSPENVTKAMRLFAEENKVGLPLMEVHRKGVEDVLGGINLREHSLANIPTNYKIPTYGTQKAGDFGKSIVLDTHESKGLTQASELHPYFTEQGGFGPNEYGAGEAGMLSIAEEMGIPGGMAQAGRWFGGGDITGLRSPRGDALDLLEKQVAYTLHQRGIQPNPANIREEVLRQIMTGEGTLLPWWKKDPLPDVRMKGLQRAEGGEVDLEAEFRKADMIAPQHFGEGGEADKPVLKGETAKPSLKEELDNYIQQENLNTLLQELARRIQLSGEMAQSREGKQAFGRLGYRQPIGDDMSVGVGASGHYFKGDGFKNADVDRADMSLSKRFKDESELRARLGANLNEQMGKRGLDELMLEYEIPFKDGGKAKKKSKGYGERIDGTEKERGFLGEIRMPDGRDVMTEVSVGMPNTDELFRPSIISGMHPADLNYLRETGIVPEDLYQASLLHAQKRIKEGKSPFWNAKEDAEPQHFGLGGLAKGIKKIADTAKKVTAKDNLSKYMQGSKAVDEAGNPKVYYHGTTAKDDFSEFSPASFFTDSPKEASAYTMYKDLERKEKALKKYSLSNDVSNAGSYVPYTGTLSDIVDPQVGALYATDNGAYRYLGDGRWEGMSKLDVDYNKYDPKTDSMMLKKVKKGQAVDTVREHKQWAHNTFTEGEGGRVYPVYLDIKNPVELSALEANVLGKRLGADDKLVQEFIDKYAKQGYDAIVTKSDEAAYFPEVRESLGGIPTQYIPFRPEQIKSAVGNVGTYDPNVKDILKADGGEVKGYKEGGDLEEEFRKADMIDMSGFRQDPLEKATRRADSRPKKQSSMSELNKRLNIAKEVGAELADEFKQKSAKEVKAATRSPKGAVDLLRNIASQYAAMAEDSPIIPTLTGSSQNELAKLALTAMKGKKALEKEYANRKPFDLMGKELSAYDMKTMGDGMLSKAIMGDAEPMPIVSTIVDFASPFAGRALAKGAKAIAPDVMRAIEKATVDPYKFNIVKSEGGQFIDSTLKENLKELKQGGEDNQINKALDAWVDSTLRKYVVNRMGTESDEVRKLFDKGITHVDPEQLRGAPSVATLEQHRARLPGSGKRAETEVGQAWEDASDYSLYGRRRSSYDDRDVEKYPWLSKMAPEDMVYGASVDSSALKDRLGFGHVIDVIRGDLRSGKLRPEQLNKVSVEDAIKRTHAFNQEMAKKAEETAITVQSGMPVHREYPEGYKWVELKYTEPTDGLPKGYEVNVVDYGNGEKKYFASTPNTRSSAFETEEEAQQELERYAKNFKSFREKNKTQEMLTYEGDTMGHCVGSYCEDVMGGDTRIFSLRDSKGEPHVTIEVRAPSGYLKAKKATELRAQGMSAEEAELATENLGNEIVQIKGKGNAKPSAKYIPFVQDFVKNPVVEREWADVGDFRNTDFINANLLRKEGVMPDADTETMNTVLQELDRIYPMNKLPGGQREFVGEYGELLPTSDMLKTQIQDLASPYLTKEDIINHLRSKEALPVEQSYSKYYENLPKDEGMAHGGDVHMAKGGFMGAVETAGKLGREGLRRFNDKLNKLSRNVAYNTYEQVPYTGAKHLEGMPGKSFESKLLFTEEAPWGSPEKDADLLAKYLGLESGPSQKGVGLYQPPIEGAPLEFNPQISSRTLVKSDKGRYNENLIAEPDKASMTALGATRGYLDVQGASPWVRPSQGSGRLYNGFHISLNGKPTEEEMRKIGEIQARYGFWGAGDLGKSGVYVGFNPDMTRADLNKMQRAFRKDIKEALGDRVAGVKMMKSEGDYPAFEEAWKAPQGTGTVTRQLMEYLDTAKEKNPLLAEYYAQKPSTELQKLMQEMNIRDIKAPEKYGVGAPREDVMKARDIFSEYGIEGLRDALNRGEYLPAAVAIPSGIELFKDDN